MSLPWWATVLIGVAGGVVNALLVHQGVLWWPRNATDRTGRRGWDLGFLANLALGGAAGWLAATVPSATAGANPGSAGQAGAAFIAGIGGAAFMNNLLQQRQITVLQEKVDALDQAAKKVRQKVGRGR
jgi:hypothetical protein